MDDSVFNKIVERLLLKKINPLVFILNGFGEPLIDRMIFERIKTLKKSFPNSIFKFYTNFNLVNDVIINKIFEGGLDEINISFNVYDKNNYEKTIGISYDQSLKNLKKLIGLRNEKKSPLKIRMSMALVEYNQTTVRQFIKNWASIIDSVSVNKVYTYNQSVNDVSGENKINFNKATYRCKYLWNTITFGVTGDIYLCCLDYEGKYNFGNIKHNKILEMFYSKQLETIRKLHLENKIQKISMYSTCYTPYKNGTEWLISNLY